METSTLPSPRDPDATTARVFYALWPDPQVRRWLVEKAADIVRHAGGRPTRAENLHLTLAFLGEVATERIDALCAIGAELARARPAIAVYLDRVGSFRRQGIGWAGPSALPEALALLARDLGEALGQAGFRIERGRFVPHVTLARRCKSQIATASVAPIDWRVDDLTLVASTLTPRGSDYRRLGCWPLATR